VALPGKELEGRWLCFLSQETHQIHPVPPNPQGPKKVQANSKHSVYGSHSDDASVMNQSFLFRGGGTGWEAEAEGS
jgi:hypothetical protein